MEAEVTTRSYEHLEVRVLKDGPNPSEVYLRERSQYPGYGLSPWAAKVLGTALIEAANEAIARDKNSTTD